MKRYPIILFSVVTLITVACSILDSEPLDFHDFRIIAHKGYWKSVNSAENSISALIAADKLGIDGSSIDVSCTSDDSIIVAHGPNHRGMVIAETPFIKLREKHLSNGEVLPTLNEYLNVADSIKTRMKLFIEIKDKGTENRIIDMVESHNLLGNVVFTSYSLSSCNKVLKRDSTLTVGNHRGELKPEELHKYGIKFMCYNIDILKVHPEWIKEAHRLGMWVVAGGSRKSELMWLVTHEVDYIGTDDPVYALEFRDASGVIE